VGLQAVGRGCLLKGENMNDQQKLEFAAHLGRNWARAEFDVYGVLVNFGDLERLAGWIETQLAIPLREFSAEMKSALSEAASTQWDQLVESRMSRNAHLKPRNRAC
jgi:hypothetical protein